MVKKIQGRMYIEGLKDRPKGGRHSKISKQAEYRIKTILKENNQQHMDGLQNRLKR
jgi:hypothetical protein